MPSELEDSIKMYKLFGVVFGKKDSVTPGQIPVFATGEENTLEDSGVDGSTLADLANPGPMVLQNYTTAGLSGLSPTTGMMVWNTDLGAPVVWDGAAWKIVALIP